MRWGCCKPQPFYLLYPKSPCLAVTIIPSSGLGSLLHTHTHTPKPLKPGFFLEASWAPPPSPGCQTVGQHAQKSKVAAVSLEKCISEGLSPGPIHLVWSRASASSPLCTAGLVCNRVLTREEGFLLVRWGKGVSGMWAIPAGVLWDSCRQEWEALLRSVP